MGKENWIRAVLLVGSLGCINPAVGQSTLTLSEAIAIAQSEDPWLQGSRYREEAVLAQSEFSLTLPDPIVSLGLMNMPVDNFDFGREPMTQINLNVSQIFPRGETRDLQSLRLRELGEQYPAMRRDRMAALVQAVTSAWLEVYRGQQMLELVEADLKFFEHLLEIAESRYRNTATNILQQDLLKGRVEVSKTKDRLEVIRQQLSVNEASLHEWLPNLEVPRIDLDDVVTTLNLETLLTALKNPDFLSQRLLAHPRIKVLDQQIAAAQVDVQLAEQKYQPQWGLNASYGYRDDDPFGNNRSDFFSLGVSFDVPLFTAKRQDREVDAALSTASAVGTEKILALRSMRASLEASYVKLQGFDQRLAVYTDHLLPETKHQSRASLSAYAADEGDFEQVLRSRVIELGANTDFLNITVDRLRAISEMRYLLGFSNEAHTGGQ